MLGIMRVPVSPITATGYMTDLISLESMFARIKASAQAAGAVIVTAHQPRPPRRTTYCDVLPHNPIICVDYADRIGPYKGDACED